MRSGAATLLSHSRIYRLSGHAFRWVSPVDEGGSLRDYGRYDKLMGSESVGDFITKPALDDYMRTDSSGEMMRP